MSKLKKLVLGLSVLTTMLIAFVIGVVGTKNNSATLPVNSENQVNIDDKTDKYVYKAGEVSIKEGKDVINFEYIPSQNSTSIKVNATTTAYEYVIGNNMSTAMALDLNEIEVTGVTVRYHWSPSQVTSFDGVVGEDEFEIQTLESKGDKVFLYILVTPDTSVPTSFVTDVKWILGEKGTVNYIVNGTPVPQTIIKGHEATLKTDLTIPEGYQVEGYYLDATHSEVAPETFTTQGHSVYVRLELIPNLPSSWLYYNGDDAEGNPTYCVTWGNSTNEPLPENLVIPSTYDDGDNGLGEVIGIYTDGGPYGCALMGDEVKTLVLPYTMQSAPLDMCTGLTSVDFSACTRLTNISFYGCSSLVSVDFSGCSSLTAIEGFSGCTSLTSLDKIPDWITSIDVSGCSNLVSINLPKDLEYLNVSGTGFTSLDLSGCASLTTLYCSDSIGFTSWDLSECTSLTDINFGGNETIQSITLPSTLTTIQGSAFSYCANLTNLTIPASVSWIAPNAFLETYTLLNTLVIDGEDDWYYTGSETNWQNREGGISATLTASDLIYDTSDSLAGYYWYRGGTGGSGDSGETSNQVTIDNVVYEIISENNYKAVSVVDEIVSSLSLDSRTTIIGSGMQTGNVASLDLSNCTNLTTVEDGAFSGESLSYVNLSGCTKLSYLGDNAFNVAYVTERQIDIDFTTLTNLTYLGDRIFANVKNISVVDLSNCTKLTHIGDNAFESSSISSITFPDNLNSSLVYIGAWAFCGCGSLTSIELPSTVELIGAGVFENSALTSISFSGPDTYWYYTTDSAKWETILEVHDTTSTWDEQGDSTVEITTLCQTPSNFTNSDYEGNYCRAFFYQNRDAYD